MMTKYTGKNDSNNKKNDIKELPKVTKFDHLS